MKWSRKNIFEIPPFSIRIFFLIDRRSFDQKYKFSKKDDMVRAWRNFKNIFSRPLFTIIFMPEMLKFHPYFILTGETTVGFVIYCVLICSAEFKASIIGGPLPAP